MNNYILIVFATLIVCLNAVVPGDKIDNLPGINYQINFNQYAGYLQPDSDNFFHYWFIESQQNPAADPLVLWLNGGPGCSSLFGLFVENGPFKMTDNDNTISENVFAWNKIANVLYLESPAWVGFSWSNNSATSYSDDQTASLNYKALVNFFTKYPEYSKSPFFITGESYGGVYLPMLADQIISNGGQIFENFQGVAIGNGYMTDPYLQDSIVPFMYNHLLVGEDLWAKVSFDCCDGNPMKCDYYGLMQDKYSECYNLTFLISNMPAAVGLDPYNLYDACYFDAYGQNQMKAVEYNTYLRRFNEDIETVRNIARKYGIEPVAKLSSDSSSSSGYPDCYYPNAYVDYLSRADVRSVLRIPDFVSYQDCNLTVNAIYQQQYEDQIDHMQQVLKAKVRMMCYNGDVDTVCNALGDQRFLHENMSLTQKGKTVPWTYAHDTYETAGWQTHYKYSLTNTSLDFLTVRGSGHYVPQDKPGQALQMIANFIRHVEDYSTQTFIDVTPQPLLLSLANMPTYTLYLLLFVPFILIKLA